ncbi:unnamed protein product, partial [Rotaria sp. Silwood2]
STSTSTTTTTTTGTTSTSTSTTTTTTGTTSTSTSTSTTIATSTLASTTTTTGTSSTSTSSTSSSTSTMTTTATTVYTPDGCRNSSQVALANGTCISSNSGQELSAGILNNGNGSSVDLANALSLYISSSASSNLSSTSNSTVTINKIDEVLDKLNNVSITVNSTNSFLFAQELNKTSDDIVLGARFQRESGGRLVTNSTEQDALNSQFSAAAIISKESLENVTSLKMFIIDKPTMYKDVDNSTNKSLASSLIVGSVTRIGSRSNAMNISLYFKVLPEYQPNVSAAYLCSFYDTNSSRWDETGCSNPRFNEIFGRYECNCNHLTSFALIWLPQSLLGSYGRTLRAADIASLVFQSVSVVCFLVIIIHAIYVRVSNPLMQFQANNLLPLISCATNFITIIFVAQHIINHVRNATSPHQTYERMKRCILVLLSSCVTQGVGWLFGPFISFVSPTAGEVLEWFFIVFNGLEGVWSVLLYLIIRSQRIDEQKRVTAAVEITRSSSIRASRYERRSDREDRRRSSARIREVEVVQRNVPRKSADVSNDLSDRISIDLPVNEKDISLL